MRREALLENFNRHSTGSQCSLPGISAYIDSFAESTKSGADIYGVIEYPFDLVEREIMSASSWCNIVILHPNIKACTYRGSGNNWRMIIFNSDKTEQTLADASPLEFTWEVTRQAGYFDFSLRTSEGPFSTKDHRFALEAAEWDRHRTVIHLRYSYGYSALSNIFMKSYFAMFNNDKVGFSIIDRDRQGNPVYVSGLRGLNERNVVRYYLAILAYLDAVDLPAELRFEKSLNRWHDMASQSKMQLRPGEKKEYISRKNLDLRNQMQLQAAVSEQLK